MDQLPSQTYPPRLQKGLFGHAAAVTHHEAEELVTFRLIQPAIPQELAELVLGGTELTAKFQSFRYFIYL